jgi:hypothetical protein
MAGGYTKAMRERDRILNKKWYRAMSSNDSRVRIDSFRYIIKNAPDSFFRKTGTEELPFLRTGTYVFDEQMMKYFEYIANSGRVKVPIRWIFIHVFPRGGLKYDYIRLVKQAMEHPYLGRKYSRRLKKNLVSLFDFCISEINKSRRKVDKYQKKAGGTIWSGRRDESYFRNLRKFSKRLADAKEKTKKAITELKETRILSSDLIDHIIYKLNSKIYVSEDKIDIKRKRYRKR